MSQINIDPNDRTERVDRVESDSQGRGPLTVATKNLTWAIAAVIVIAAIVIAIVYLVQNLHL
jgi:low affinity Fe/Cu permease